MTFFFAGEQLHHLSANDLEKWHAKCSIAASRLDKQVLTFNRLELFPPGKNNLVVAIFDASNELVLLQREIAEIAVEAGIAEDQFASWIPHITLGKIGASKVSIGSVGEKIVSGDDYFIANTAKKLGSTVHGIEIKGVTPKQKWLDWDLTFQASTSMDIC